MKFLVLISLLLGGQAYAQFQGKSGSGANLGMLKGIRCTSELSCAKGAGDLLALGLSGQKDLIIATAGAIPTAQCGAVLVNSGATAVVLPQASTVPGCELTFVCGNASNFDVDPFDGIDQITTFNIAAATATSNVAPAAGDAIRCSTVGASLKMVAISGNRWAVIGVANGTWADIN